MRTASLTSSVLALTMTALCVPAFADDLAPPTWRGGAGTTVQHWDFSGGPAGGAPDAGPFSNPNGIPNFTAPPPTNWIANWAGRNDVWALNVPNALVFDVPNFNQPTHQKDVVVQITFWANAASPPVIGSTVASSNGPFSIVGGPVLTALGNDWYHEVTVWRSNICPAFERISIFPPIPGITSFVDQVVIDTRCYPVPTPGAFALAGFAGCLVRRRR